MKNSKALLHIVLFGLFLTSRLLLIVFLFIKLMAAIGPVWALSIAVCLGYVYNRL